MQKAEDRAAVSASPVPIINPNPRTESNRIEHRRRVSKALDELLGVERLAPWDPFSCDGRHHAGQDHDWWGVCTGMARSYPERDYAGRALTRSGWTP